VQPPAEAELVLAEGAAVVKLGAGLLKAKKVQAWHPGAAPAQGRAAA
jgi:hypothetical protein